jgi:streptogramin lyase
MAAFRPVRMIGARALAALILAGAVAAVVGWGVDAGSGAVRESRIVARIHVGGNPFRVETGGGYAWVLRRSSPCARAGCTLVRIDPSTNRAVGTPTRLPGDPWGLMFGAGSLWVTSFDGRVTRVDARTGRVTARISARPIYFGSEITYDGRYLWTTNDDERYKRGSTVSKIDPRRKRVVGKPVVLRNPQSLTFGGGAIWVADHGGALVKIDPTTRKILARTRLNFGPHGVVVTNGAVYVADAHSARLLEADLETAEIRRRRQLPVGAIFPVAGAGSIWSGSASIWGGPPQVYDDRVLRIDPQTLELDETIHAGGNVPGVAFGFASVWAAAVNGYVIRIEP